MSAVWEARHWQLWEDYTCWSHGKPPLIKSSHGLPNTRNLSGL
jgi:hypothetical protein